MRLKHALNTLIVILLLIIVSTLPASAAQTTVDNYPIPGPGDTSGASGNTVGFSPIPGPRNSSGASGDTISLSPIPGPVDTSGADATITFWQLPLRIQVEQITWIAAVTAAALAAVLKLWPIVIGKLKNRRDNEIRERIYNYIKNNPGTTMADISRRENLNLGTIRYHITRLQSDHKITLVKSEKFVRLFRNSGVYTEREKAIISSISRPAAISIVSYLREAPGATIDEIAGHLHITSSGAYVQLKKLIRDGVVYREPAGRFLKYYLNEEVLALIARQLPVSV
ncbi:winged helix-turn-helix transcriptional regulator [Methanocella arvoryzae]|uniref:Transcriptional regulator (ArsR family) n=1 Tax=Methanocella arvoryzae (strain DSM 22066 / NBRC 105507 / MRE50) TaxID=351160 RepID=Q0W4K7_METAR|nr:winged helix-turn-helix transcriptional regulator [Methanocella arvoryzae]CAJ36686.1 putative transcriptional regulator (ArsR family) [Methanocella arvoryzae MRE50]